VKTFADQFRIEQLFLQMFETKFGQENVLVVHSKISMSIFVKGLDYFVQLIFSLRQESLEIVENFDLLCNMIWFDRGIFWASPHWFECIKTGLIYPATGKRVLLQFSRALRAIKLGFRFQKKDLLERDAQIWFNPKVDTKEFIDKIESLTEKHIEFVSTQNSSSNQDQQYSRFYNTRSYIWKNDESLESAHAQLEKIFHTAEDRVTRLEKMPISNAFYITNLPHSIENERIFDPHTAYLCILFGKDFMTMEMTRETMDICDILMEFFEWKKFKITNSLRLINIPVFKLNRLYDMGTENKRFSVFYPCFDRYHWQISEKLEKWIMENIQEKRGYWDETFQPCPSTLAFYYFNQELFEDKNISLDMRVFRPWLIRIVGSIKKEMQKCNLKWDKCQVNQRMRVSLGWGYSPTCRFPRANTKMFDLFHVSRLL